MTKLTKLLEAFDQIFDTQVEAALTVKPDPTMHGVTRAEKCKWLIDVIIESTFPGA